VTETAAAPLTVVIVDDEPVARAGLRHMLAGCTWLQCIAEAASGPEAIEVVDRLRPDILLLDIELPGMKGTDVLRQLVHRPCVIFTTAYAEHAVTAFELGALDYLLKPFGADRLESALERIRAAVGEPAPTTMERLADAWGQGPISRLFVRNGRNIVPIAVTSVTHFEAVGDYVSVHAGAAHLLHLSLGRLEKRLDAERFVRIHRAHIVNLDHVATFFRQLDGQVIARMRDGTKLPVSRARAKELREMVSPRA
jgi:two-component system LytT family response regulator